MNRRGFLGSILAACAAPAIVRADSVMRIVPLDTTILTRPLIDVAAILAEMDAAKAMEAGLQIREWSQFDIGRMVTITRYDVLSESSNYLWQQDSVDFMGGDPAENRAMARALLAGRLRAEGLKPVEWKGELPEGARIL